MFRQRTTWLSFCMLVAVSLACNAFTGAVEPSLTLPPPPTADSSPTATMEAVDADSDVIAPTATLAVTDETVTTAAASNATITMLVDLNVRSGPGVNYDRVSFVEEGESAPIIGKDPSTGWWKIECPPRAEVTECWVSGGAQYTEASNVEGVPVAAAPPTPTPVSPTPEPDAMAMENGLLVYESDDQLWAIELDMSQDPPVGGEMTLLAESEHSMVPFISPDGQKVAYFLETQQKNELHVVDSDGSGHRMLVDSEDIPLTIEGDTSDLGAYLGAAHWLPDSQAIAYNTRALNLVGPGSFGQDDLWTVTLDGTSAKRLTSGKGGSVFAISRDDRVILSQAEAVYRADVDGSDWEEVITFDFINTASEYAYTPQPQWTADGDEAYLAIPSDEPFTPSAHASLWRVPSDGEAEYLQDLPGNILFQPVVWSADGSSLAYAQYIMDGSNSPSALILADGDGGNQTEYTTGNQLTVYEWSPNGSHFLYAGIGFYAVGEAGSDPIETSIPMGTRDGRWLTAQAFLVVHGTDSDWTIVSGNLDGESAPLANADTNFAHYDVWVP